MTGWRARLGFLVPPGNPTVEPEMIALAPQGVTVHFSRLVAHGATGSHAGQEERNRTMVEHAAESAGLLGDARARSRQARDLRRLRHDVARASPRRRARAGHGLWAAAGVLFVGRNSLALAKARGTVLRRFC